MNAFDFLRLRRAVPLFCLALAAVPCQALAQEGTLPPGDLYRHLQQAAVEILSDAHLAGSGSVIDRQGIVLTAAHVVTTSKKQLEVLTSTGQRLAAKIIALDLGHDLALLQLPLSDDDYPSLELADAFPQPGQTVYVFGTALFRHGILMKGSVARNATTFEYVDGHYIEIVPICAPSPAGLSGAPWVNRTGRVIGVQSSVMIVNKAQQGISFAAPSSAVAQLLKAKASIKTPTLGAAFEEIWEQDSAFLGALAPDTRGLVLRQVKRSSPAARAGLHDFQIITQVDGRRLEKRDALLRHIRSKQPGQPIRLTITDRTGKNPATVVLRLESL